LQGPLSATQNDKNTLHKINKFQKKKKKAKKKKEKKKRVIQFDGDPNEFLDIESLHIGIYLKPHDYVLVHLTLN
jgi:hypothetical protein